MSPERNDTGESLESRCKGDTARGTKFGRKGESIDKRADSFTSTKFEEGWAAVPRTGPAPSSIHSTASRVVKGEDVMLVQPLSMAESTLFMVCDGHSGIDAATFVSTHFVRLLSAKLPSKLPDFTHFRETEMFAENVRKALCQTFFHLDNEWALGGLNSGTTCTVVLVTGWLITVANVGDSSVVLDTGSSVLELTKSHRLHESLEEQDRLKRAGVELAPLGFHLQGPARKGEIGVGPLRMWPGGLCVARSIGDLDAGPEVMPLPNIRQVMIPINGCRLILASDGLWDVLTLSKACTSTRARGADDAAAALVASVLRDLRVMDDTSVVVIDVLPSDVPAWPSAVLRADNNNSSSGGKKAKFGGLFSCFRPEASEPDSRDVCGSGHVSYLADVDTLKAFPSLKAMLNRTMIHNSYHMPPNGGQDFTQHGVAPWRQFGSPDSTHHSGCGSGTSLIKSKPCLSDSTLSLNHILSISEDRASEECCDGGGDDDNERGGGGRLPMYPSAVDSAFGKSGSGRLDTSPPDSPTQRDSAAAARLATVAAGAAAPQAPVSPRGVPRVLSRSRLGEGSGVVWSASGSGTLLLNGSGGSGSATHEGAQYLGSGSLHSGDNFGGSRNLAALIIPEVAGGANTGSVGGGGDGHRLSEAGGVGDLGPTKSVPSPSALSEPVGFGRSPRT